MVVVVVKMEEEEEGTSARDCFLFLWASQKVTGCDPSPTTQPAPFSTVEYRQGPGSAAHRPLLPPHFPQPVHYSQGTILSCISTTATAIVTVCRIHIDRLFINLACCATELSDCATVRVVNSFTS